MNSLSNSSNNTQYALSSGFTIVELMIATTVLTTLLLLAGATFTQISRLYYKGIITTKTQNASRSVIDDISRNIQFSNGQTTAGSGNGAEVLCIGQTRYTYVKNRQIKAGTTSQEHALWQDKLTSPGSCLVGIPNLFTANPGGISGKELLENGMRLKSFSVTENSNIFYITIGVIYGDDDLLIFSPPPNSQPETCKGDPSGSQWCAVSELNTQIFSRVRVQ